MHAQDGAESVQIVSDGVASSGSSNVPARRIVRCGRASEVLRPETQHLRAAAGGKVLTVPAPTNSRCNGVRGNRVTHSSAKASTCDGHWAFLRWHYAGLPHHIAPTMNSSPPC